MPEVDERAEAEAAIRERCAAGDHATACTRAFDLYGREVFAYLVAVTRDDDAATDAYGQLALVVWQALSAFRWDASLRTWIYALARSALSRLARRPERRRPHVDIDDSAAGEFAARVRTRTAAYLRTTARTAVAEIRANLPPEDRELLILRVDRELDWLDIARIHLAEDDPARVPGAAALTREAARLRKRFERIKETIRTQVRRPDADRE